MHDSCCGGTMWHEPDGTTGEKRTGRGNTSEKAYTVTSRQAITVPPPPAREVARQGRQRNPEATATKEGPLGLPSHKPASV